MPEGEGTPGGLTAPGTPFQRERAARHARIKTEVAELRRAGVTWTKIAERYGWRAYKVFTSAERRALSPPRAAGNGPPAPKPNEVSQSATATRQLARSVLDLRAAGRRWDTIAAELDLSVAVALSLASHHFRLFGLQAVDLTDGAPADPDEPGRTLEPLPAGHPISWHAISGEPYPT